MHCLVSNILEVEPSACTTRAHRFECSTILRIQYSAIQQRREKREIRTTPGPVTNMPKPYSEDLRWRAVWLNVVRGMSSFEIADLLFMSERSVQRYLSLFHSTGSVAPKDSTGGPGRILTEVEQFSILQSLIYNPSVFLHEIKAQLYDSTGKCIHASTICRTVHQHNFTHKKFK